MLSPTQHRLSRQIYEAVPMLPKEITELVSEYYSDQDLVDLALSDPKIKFINNSNEGCPSEFRFENPEVMQAIKYCLVSPVCDPAIKAKVISRYVSSRDKKNFKVKYNESDHMGCHTTYGEKYVSPELALLKKILSQLSTASQKINLDGVDLSGLNLRDLNFDGITAVGANFSRCDMSGIKMIQSDLTGADLRWANMRSASLSSAVFCYANLAESNLSNADLDNANFTGARFFRTYLSKSETDRTYMTEVITGDRSLSKFLGNFNNILLNRTIVSGKVYLSSTEKNKESPGSCIIS